MTEPPMQRSIVSTFSPIALAASVMVLLSGCDKVQELTHSTPTPAPIAVPAQGSQIGMLVADFSQLVEREGPAVVNISAQRDGEPEDNAAASPFPFPIPENDPLFEFFKRFMPPNGAQQEPQDREAVSYGSGFIVSPDGYVLTNAHVVAGSSQLQVKLADKREMKARLIGLDKRTDVALLKVDEGDKLPTVKIGNAATLKVGEWVAAIGAPFGFDNTVTAGIVSAKGRSLPDDTFVQFIQTDVAINPGNSGGPLFNLKGEVVGINSQIYSRSGGFMGISFSIPIDVAMNVAEQLKKTGKVSRGQLGVHIQELSKELAQSFGRDSAKGALIVNIEPESPAAKSGLQVGDIIISVDGKAVDSSRDLPMLIGARLPGTQVTLGLWRKGKEVSASVVLAEMKSDAPPAKKSAEPKEGAMSLPKLGLNLSALSREQRRESGLAGGLLVESVTGLAAKSGLMAGDIIVAVNQTETPDFDSLQKALSASGQTAALLVRRADNTLFIPLRLKE